MDQPGTGPAFVDDTEGLERVNGALGALWDLLVEAGGEHLLITTDVQSSVAAPTWPSDMMQLIAIEVADDGTTDFHPMERADLRDVSGYDVGTGRPTHYLFTDTLDTSSSLAVLPPVSGATFTYRLFYVPEPADISAGSDEVTLPNRWHSWIEYQVAIDMLLKEESDAGALMQQQTKVEAAILKVASRRDLYRSSKVRDSRGVLRGRRHPREHWRLYDRMGR